MKLEVCNGSFSYQDKLILENINFQLEKGEVLSILGPNGIGKTTLVKCIAGLSKWSRGHTLLDGENIEKIKSNTLWNKLSYVPQKRSFTFSYTGLEMVLIGLTVQFSPFAQPKEIHFQKALAKMKELRIENLANQDCNTMSGGQLQMILIARALVNDPEIIILDEPESGLDFKNQLIILDLIGKLSYQNNITVILNTHYPGNAFQISDKCLLLGKDKTSKFGIIEDILNPKNIKETFEVEVIMEEIKKGNKIYKNILPIGLS